MLAFLLKRHSENGPSYLFWALDAARTKEQEERLGYQNRVVRFR